MPILDADHGGLRLLARYPRQPVSEALPIEDPASELPGPYAVGEYAEALRDRLRAFARVQLIGEIANLRPPTRARAYFELRDADGAIPCAMWRNDWDRLGRGRADARRRRAGDRRGRLRLLPGQRERVARRSASRSARSASPARATCSLRSSAPPRARRRRPARAPARARARPLLPRTIGDVCGEERQGRARTCSPALARRGWAGRVVWAFAPVQDRNAAPRIGAALRELAASGEVEVIVVARGGGSLTDLLAFSDELLCRTVALLPVPVIASIGHHTDRTLLDEVAAASCSTPTHAAEEAVPLNCVDARRAQMRARAQRLRRPRARRRRSAARDCWLRSRARRQRTSRATAAPCTRACASCAPPRGGIVARGARADAARRAGTLERLREGAIRDCARAPPGRARAPAPRARAPTIPQRTLARGYALVEDPASGDPVSAASRRARRAACACASPTTRVRCENRGPME